MVALTEPVVGGYACAFFFAIGLTGYVVFQKGLRRALGTSIGDRCLQGRLTVDSFVNMYL